MRFKEMPPVRVLNLIGYPLIAMLIFIIGFRQPIVWLFLPFESALLSWYVTAMYYDGDAPFKARVLEKKHE